VKQPFKRDWVLTEDAFNKLLECLDKDRLHAGEKYEQLRRSLIKYFNWRGSLQAEVDADDTIDRLARKLYEGSEFEDIYTYALGMARLVVLESLRTQEKAQKLGERLSLSSSGNKEDEDDGKRRACFDTCMANLSADKRNLIVHYYQGDKGAKITNRQRLAEKLGMPINRLRIQAHRIREKLEACLNACLASSSDDGT